jgi:hypothetical protein
MKIDVCFYSKNMIEGYGNKLLVRAFGSGRGE